MTSNTQFLTSAEYSSEGAAAGYSAFGMWGAIAGGATGAISGWIGGGQMSRAQTMLKRASKIERKQSYLEAAVARRDIIRTIRAERAAALAAVTAEGEGGMQSSPTLGGLASIGSQGNFNLGFFDSTIAHLLQIQKFKDRAGKYAGRAATTKAIHDFSVSMMNSMGSMGGSGVTSSQMGGGSIAAGSSSTGRLPVGGTMVG